MQISTQLKENTVFSNTHRYTGQPSLGVRTISNTPPVIHNRRKIAESRLFSIESLDLTFSNGEQRTYERLVPGGYGAVLIVAMKDADTVLMIREYCAGTEDYQLVLPKGRIEANESAIDAANRELAEEIGHAGKTLTSLGKLTVSPGYMAHATEVVLAEDLFLQSAEGDEPEPLEVVPCSLNDVYQLSQRADCTEARTIAALYLSRDYLTTRDN